MSARGLRTAWLGAGTHTQRNRVLLVHELDFKELRSFVKGFFYLP